MAEIISFDSDLHLEEFRQMNIETNIWHWEQVWENHQMDVGSILGKTPQEYVDSHLSFYTSLHPPEGSIYMIDVDGYIAGMGTIKKLRDNVGELKRMYTYPRYRRRGYARQMLNKLLEAGGESGFTSFLLDTAKFSFAHYLYRSVGFKEIDPYPESEIPQEFRKYWFFMEKKES
jgi:GNAT superfamily N-acetyltransferase